MGPEAPPAPAPTLEEARAWIGAAVDEVGGARVGRARGLFVDEESGEPTWLVLKLGRLTGRLVVAPVRDCAAAAGRVWVAHPRQAIRAAPVVDPTRALLGEHEQTICAHYGIGAGVGRAAEVAGRPEGSVTARPV